MFNIDIFSGKDPLNLYLSTPDNKIITCINDGIDVTSSNLSVPLNQQYELNFTYNSKTVDHDTGELIDSPVYEYIVEGMYLALEHIGLFKMNSPVINSDGTVETKDVVAKSCDCELEDKIFTAKINTGENDSQEFLVTYDDGETEILLNEYTGIPFDWIVLYNTFPEQLQVLLTDYNNGVYGTPNTDISLTNADKIKKLYEYFKLIPRLATKFTKDSDDNLSRSDYVIYTYDENNEDELTMMAISKSFGSRIQELITFYTKYRNKLSLLTLALEKMEGNWTVGEIYGVSDGDYSLCNKKGSFDANESIYSFLTQTLAQVIECVVYFDIKNRKVNVIPADKIGNDTGIIMPYETLVNSVNISCDENNLATRLYVSGANGLGIEQVNYGESNLDDLTYKISARDSNGNRIYVSDALAEKYKAYQKLREDNRNTWVSYTKEYNAYLDDIAELYNRVPNGDLKNEWGNYSQDLLDETLRTYNNLLVALETMYKEDYGSVGLNTDGSINEKYIQKTEYWYDYQAYKNIIVQLECAIAVWPSYSDENKWTQEQRDKYLKSIKAYETDWTLYGIDELNAKIETYNNSMKVLLENETVCRVSEDSEDIKPWDNMTDEERNKYGSVEQTYINAYDMYNEYLTNRNSAQVYLETLKQQVKSLEARRDAIQSKRQALKETVSYQNYFTPDERKALNLLYKDAEYTNENILTTSIDNSISTVDVQYELLRDAQEKLEIYSRPQLIFETDVNNFLSLPEFKPLWKDFQLGNYIYIEFRDNTYMKTRLVNYQINPFNPDINELTIGFSSFIISKSKRWDVSSLLNMSIANGLTSFSSGNGSGSGGLNSDNLSNLMIEKLLNSESFGTKVSNVILDTIKLNEITAKKGIFNALYGEEFNFANGHLVYKNNVLQIDGKISWSNVQGGADYVDNSIKTVKDSLDEFINGDFADIVDKQKSSISTWHQTTDPSSDWTTSEKGEHKGDLWYNSSANSNKTFYWNGTSWIQMNIPKEVFDRIDGKAQIFTLQPDRPYHIGDLWINDGELYKATTTRDTFLSSDWVVATKYTEAIDLLKQGLGTTQIGNDYVFSPQIVGGSINIGDSNTGVNAKITSDGHLTATGATITGDIVATSLTLGTGVSISSSKVSGLADVATSGDYNSLKNQPKIPKNVTELIGGNNILYSTQISVSNSSISDGLSKQTITVGDKSFDLINAGDFVLLGQPKGTFTEDGSQKYIRIDSDGLLRAHNAIIYGTIYATNGEFTGDIKAGSTITCGDNFKVDKNGHLTTISADIIGDIKATKLTAQECISIYYKKQSDLMEYERYIIATNAWSEIDRTLVIGPDIEHVNDGVDEDGIPIFNWRTTCGINIKNNDFLINEKNDMSGEIELCSYATTIFGDLSCGESVSVHGELFTEKNIQPTESLTGFVGTSSYPFSKIYTSGIRLGSGNDLAVKANIYTRWFDGEAHDMIVRGSDGLTMGVGWAGDSFYTTTLRLRSQTVQVVNSSGTTTLSDERLKENFLPLENWESFYMDLEPLAFKYINGSSGRFHIGFKAQQVQTALENNNLSTKDFAGFVKYKVNADDDCWHGYETEYGLIYTEFTALNTYMGQKALKEIELLKKENSQLKSRVEQLENR